MGRLTLVTVIAFVVAVCLLTGPSAHTASESEVSQAPATNAPVDWGLLFLYSRKVTRVKVVFTADADKFVRGLLVIGERGRVREVPDAYADKRPGSRMTDTSGLRYETTNRMVLGIVNASLNMPLRRAFPDTEDVGVGMGDFTYVLAHVEVAATKVEPATTKDEFATKDEFSVTVTTKGFFLGRDLELLGPRSVFYSWGLAKVLDDLLFDKTGRRLPEQVFATLSGEGKIASDKRFYQDTRQRYLSRQADRDGPGPVWGKAGSED